MKNGKHKNKFSLINRLHSFKYAFRGIAVSMKSQHNLWIHLVMTAIIIVMGFFFDVSTYEWLAILLAVGMVLTTELINTAIEYFADIIHPDYSEKIKKAKDIAAGAVLVASIIAVIIGILIFLPRFGMF